MKLSLADFVRRTCNSDHNFKLFICKRNFKVSQRRENLMNFLEHLLLNCLSCQNFLLVFGNIILPGKLLYYMSNFIFSVSKIVHTMSHGKAMNSPKHLHKLHVTHTISLMLRRQKKNSS